MASVVNLTNFCSQSSGDIKFIFIRDANKDLQNNFQDVVDEIREQYQDEEMIEIMHEKDCLAMDENELANRKCLFVFDKFDTPAFKHVSKIKDIYILGLKCVVSVIHDNLEVPAMLFHIHNLCMKDLIVCFSSIGDPEKKSRMKKLIEYMGGLHSNSLTEDITHLVTEDVFSKKYHHAGAHNIKIIHPSWIDEMWTLSQSIDFKRKAEDDEFVNKFKLKIFYNLVFSSTGLENDEKKKLIKLIEENGGEYSHTFKTSTVKVLLMKDKDKGSVKHKASLKHSIKCIDPQWIINSVEAGYAVNPEDFTIKKEGKIKSSTPTKNTSALSRFNFDNTMLSDISDMTTRSIAIDETQKSSLTRKSAHLPIPQKQNLASSSLRSAPKPSTSKDVSFKKPTVPKKTTEICPVPSPPKFEYSEDGSDESFIQILVDKTVCVYGYTNEIDSIQVLKECEKLGAKIVDLSYNKTVDYVITSTEIIEIDQPKLKFKNLVTDVWLEESVEFGRCIEPLKFYHHSIFKPVEKHQVLRDEIFVCSNYETQRQRPFIRQMVKALGGICKEALSRAEGPILICPSAEGKKYEGARNWGLTILRCEWLLECYQKRIRYDESEFLVGDTKASSKNRKKRDSIIPSSQDFSIEEEVDLQVGTPSKKDNKDVADSPRTPNASVTIGGEENRVGNISWLLEDMPTPQRNTTRDVLLDHQKKNKESPRTKLLKDLMQTPGNVQKNFKDYVPSPAPELPDCLKPPDEGKNYGIRPDSSPASQWFYKRKLEALDDRYVHVPQARRKALKNLPSTPPFSHFRHDFFKKRLSDYTSPDPRDSQESQGLFMARISASMSNEASKFLNFEDSENDGITVNKAVDSDILKLDEILKQNVEKSQEKTSRISTALRTEDLQENRNIIDYNPKSPDDLVRWSNSQAPETNSSFQEENFGDELIEKETDEKENENDENEDQEDGRENSKREFIFAISSGNNSEEKQHLYDQIERLGGTFAEQNFTHLIMAKISKSSKYFSALAAGKYVLHSDYIVESSRKNRFLEDCDRFEFGNPQFSCNVANVKDPLLLSGPYNCRLLVENNPEKYENGLFTGMKFIIIASAEKIGQFISVIESGGGTIIDEKPEFKPAVLKRSSVDYCLVENIKSLTKKDVETLKSCNVQVRNIKFIYEYLLSNNLTI